MLHALFEVEEAAVMEFIKDSPWEGQEAELPVLLVFDSELCKSLLQASVSSADRRRAWVVCLLRLPCSADTPCMRAA